jgi:hypothetical protein
MGYGLVCRECVPKPGEDLATLVPGPIQDATDSILDGRPPLFAVFDLFFGFFFIRTR